MRGRLETRTLTQAVTTPLSLDLAHVSKTYRGKVQALRGISMQVRRGEVFGLLGPNGAGKSTLVKILMTVISPTQCKGTLLGDPVGRKETLRRVGYLPEHHRFSDYLTGAQVLDFYGAMCKVPRRERRRRAGELLELVGMTNWARKRVKSYSKGMRQRIGVAQALINDPDLVLLDEPTDGVDPVGRRDIRNILVELKSRGKTVFLNSHLLSELEMVCDRVAILVQGVVSSQGTIDELTSGQQRYDIEIAAGPGEAPDAIFRAALPSLRPGAAQHLVTGESLTLDRGTLKIGTDDPSRIQGVLDALRAGGATIRTVRQVRPSLEDLFMQAVTDPNTGEALAPGAKGPSKPAAGRVRP
jgi:ABC-2 type transport system ATP-binding protein